MSAPKNASINTDPKSKFWYISFTTPDGTQKRRSTKVPVEGGLFKGERLNQKQAKNRALIEGMKIAEKECAVEEEQNNISVRKFLEEYLERRKPYVTKVTHTNMRSASKCFCSSLGSKADKPMHQIKREDAKRFVESRRAEVRANSVRKDVAHLCAAFNDAFDSEIINRNPFSRIQIPQDTTEEKIKKEAFSLEEIRFMIANFPPEWSSAVRCCYETYGQRLGDILALKWDQFDFVNRVVNITTGKTGKVLTQPMRAPFCAWAKAEMEKRGDKPSDLLHPGLYALKVNASAEFGSLLRAYKIGVASSPMGGKRRVVNSKTFHSIRATCATTIQSLGISEGMAMKLVGHDSENVHKVYIRPDIEQLREAASALPDVD